MSKTTTGECDRCGETAEGRYKWMIYRWFETFPDPPVARQFFCYRCLRTQRAYGLIALGVFVVGVGLAAAAIFWWDA